eukprot:4419946-Prymnesium_polylepis.1
MSTSATPDEGSRSGRALSRRRPAERRGQLCLAPGQAALSEHTHTPLSLARLARVPRSRPPSSS